MIDDLLGAVRPYRPMEGWHFDAGWPTLARIAELEVEWAG